MTRNGKAATTGGTASPGTAAELREVTRAAHEATRDLRQALAAAKAGIADERARAEQALRDVYHEADARVSREVSAVIVRGVALVDQQGRATMNYLAELLGCADQADLMAKIGEGVQEAAQATLEAAIQEQAGLVYKRLSDLVDDKFGAKQNWPPKAGPPLTVTALLPGAAMGRKGDGT